MKPAGASVSRLLLDEPALSEVMSTSLPRCCGPFHPPLNEKMQWPQA